MQFAPQLNTAGTPTPNIVFANRYKTKLCRHHTRDAAGEEVCTCPYKKKCMFAHLECELRTAEMNLADGITTKEDIRAFKKQCKAELALTEQLQEDGELEHADGREPDQQPLLPVWCNQAAGISTHTPPVIVTTPAVAITHPPRASGSLSVSQTDSTNTSGNNSSNNLSANSIFSDHSLETRGPSYRPVHKTRMQVPGSSGDDDLSVSSAQSDVCSHTFTPTQRSNYRPSQAAAPQPTHKHPLSAQEKKQGFHIRSPYQSWIFNSECQCAQCVCFAPKEAFTSGKEGRVA